MSIWLVAECGVWHISRQRRHASNRLAKRQSRHRSRETPRFRSSGGGYFIWLTGVSSTAQIPYWAGLCGKVYIYMHQSTTASFSAKKLERAPTTISAARERKRTSPSASFDRRAHQQPARDADRGAVQTTCNHLSMVLAVPKKALPETESREVVSPLLFF